MNNPPRTRSSLWWVAVVAATATGCSTHHDEMTRPRGEVPPVPVTLAAVERRTVQRTVSVVGTLHGQEEIVLAPKVEGLVRKIHKDVGDEVRPGDPLLELDTTDLHLAEVEAERELGVELARLTLDQLPDGPLDFEKLPAVRRATFTSENARRMLERARKLSGSGGGAISRDELERLETECNCAAAMRQEQITLAQATLASARFKQAALATARQRLADAILKVPDPPSAGADPTGYVVAARMVSEGERVLASPTTHAFRLVMDRTLKYKAAVPERHSAEVRRGQTVRIEVEAHPGKSFAGTITRLNPTVDPDTRTFHIEARVDNAGRALRAGSFAKGQIETRAEADALIVPAEALVSYAGVTKVFVIAGDKARAVEVTTGIRGPSWVEVRGELTIADRVAVTGQTQLVDGSAVRVRE